MKYEINVSNVILTLAFDGFEFVFDDYRVARGDICGVIKSTFERDGSVTLLSAEGPVTLSDLDNFKLISEIFGRCYWLSKEIDNHKSISIETFLSRNRKK